MKTHETARHPGPFRFMRADSETAGFIVAIGIVVLGVVSIPIAKWFLLGAALLGGTVALVLHFRTTPRKSTKLF